MKKVNKCKYLLHFLRPSSRDDSYIYFNSLIDLLICAYEEHIDFSVDFIKTGKIFLFEVSDLLKLLPPSVYATSYDQYFLGFVSLLLTTKERDIFKKKLRSIKNV